MKKILLLLLVLVTIQVSAQTEPFTKRTVVTAGMGLLSPWEVVYGPGDSLFVTESKGYIISRISTNSTPGVKTMLLDLTSAKADWASGGGSPQGGLMGLALHPALYSSNPAIRSAKPYVYAAFVFDKAIPGGNCDIPGDPNGCIFSTRIVRYEYRGTALINPVIILNNLPGSSDHNSGRLSISPVVEPGSDAAHTQYRLYYTIGDMGAGQLTNTTRTNNAQVLDNFEGKVLRLNTESDGDAGVDAWIPNDNPFNNGTPFTARDYVFSLGHRNPQGLVWGVMAGVPRLYSTEQSDRADDEVNLIGSGNNYGWDKVSGKCDNDVNGFKIGGQTIVSEMTNCTGTTQPVFTTFHHNGTWSSYPTNGSSNSQWPTIASSSVEFYGKNVIPGWPGSLLITPLKENKVYRLKLNAAGTAITGDTISYFRGDGSRIRRVTSDPSGLRFYVTRENNTIMEYTYTGVTLPVRLISFKATLQNTSALLEWSTSSETNTSRFVVERSLDGVSYNDIGTVAASGNNTGTLTYTYTDNNIMNQQAKVVYYRLRMVDIDESYKYSNVAAVAISEQAERIIISPNPTSGIIKVSINAPTFVSAKWNIMNNSGSVVLQNSIQLSQGLNFNTIDISKLPAGVYYFGLSGGGINQKVKIQKL